LGIAVFGLLVVVRTNQLFASDLQVKNTTNKNVINREVESIAYACLKIGFLF